MKHVLAQTSQPAQRRLRVLMITEGTYPFHWGGVSTWCHLLIRDLPQIDFELMSLAAAPNMPLQFTLPSNVVAFHPIPLWGVRERLESRAELTLRELQQRRQRTTEAIIVQSFLPLFQRFVQELFLNQHGPQSLARTIHGMHRFFLTYDFDRTMRAPSVWEGFANTIQNAFPIATAHFGYPDIPYQLADLTTAMQWLYHWLFPLGAPLPKTDVAHAAMVGICTMIGVAVKLEHGAAFMLTEHGIYLRERYLAETATNHSFFLKIFNLCFARRMTELTYALADQISPCCDYNQRWELRNGARPDQIRTIYYGVDGDTFTPVSKPFGEPPIVVWVGRIDPLKDLLTLIRAAGIVHETRPDIQFKLYGSAPAGNEAYYEKCLELRKELGVEETVIFAGFQSNVAAAFHEGDVVVLSSISEAFPFVILEAMLCAKPVVATGVGGIPEQLEGCGYALEPRNPAAMAAAILKLMSDPALCATLGQAARSKASREFTVRQSGLAHEASYRRILKRQALWEAQLVRKGRALMDRLPLQPLRHPLTLAPLLAPHAGLAPIAVCEKGAIGNIASHEPSKQHNRRNGHNGHNGHNGQHDHGTDKDENGAAARQQAATYSRAWLSLQNRYNGHNGDNKHNDHNGYANHHNGHQNNKYAVAAGAAERFQLLTASKPPAPNGQVGHRFVPTSAVTVAGPVFSAETEVRPEEAAAIATLAEEVAQRNRRPIDALEITAMIESMGVTDEVAQQRYGVADAFALGATVFARLRATEPAVPASARPALPRQSGWETLRNLSQGVLGLVPAVVLLFCIFAYSSTGQWGQNLVLALSAGMTASMLITNGFIQALSRRISIYLGLGKPALAGRFLWQSTTIIFSGLFALTGVTFFVTKHVGFFSDSERFIFSSVFLSLSALWLAAGGLALIRRSGWLSLAMISGLLCGVLVDLLLRAFAGQPLVGWHLLLSSLVGYSVTMFLILSALRQGYGNQEAAKAQTPPKLHLPSHAYLLTEAAPYFGYGFLYMAFILLPHILGWLGALGVHQMRSWAVTSVELGLTASMPPLILANGVSEHALRYFWRYAPALQGQISGGDRFAFRQALKGFYQRYALIYLCTLFLLSLGAHQLFSAATGHDLFNRWLDLPDMEQLCFIFTGGLIAYGLLGMGIFSCMFCITLGAPQLATRAVGWGLLATLLIGAPLSGIHYSYSALGFIAGALTFVFMAWRLCNRTLQAADYRFASAL